MSQPSLWHHSAFRRLWIAQVVSSAGTQVTYLALPLTAVITLHASPAQMGILGVATYLPNLLVGLVAGVWVDRRPYRPLLVGSDLGRAVILGTIPVASVLGWLTLDQLYIVAFIAGTLTVFFEVASTSVLPSVVPQHQLVEANGKLAISDSILSMAGPGLAGALIQVLSAPKAIVADALSYLLSALSLGSIGSGKPRTREAERRHMWAEIREGLRALLDTPLLRAMTLSSALGSLFLSIQNTLLVIFLTRELGLTPETVGLAFAATGGGSLLGAVLAHRVARLAGPGRAIVAGTFLVAVGGLLVPLAGQTHLALVVVLLGRVLLGVGTPIYSVNQLSLRQLLTPLALLGRVNASRRFLVFGMSPVGAAIGGALGSTLGLQTGLLVGATGFFAAFFVILLSPVRSVVEVP